MAHPLSLPPVSVEQSNRPWSKIVILLSSASLVSKVLLAKLSKVSISTDDLHISLLGSKHSKHVRYCKIFINDAVCKKRLKLFCNLKSATKNFCEQYIFGIAEGSLWLELEMVMCSNHCIICRRSEMHLGVRHCGFCN